MNIDAVNKLFNLDIKSAADMDKWMRSEQVLFKDEKGHPRDATNLEELALSRVGRHLFDAVFKPYVEKRWAKSPVELSAVAAAGTILNVSNWTTNSRYFSSVVQALPTHGCTAFVQNMLQNSLIEVHTNVNYFDVKDKITCGHTYFSGPIDSYFSDLSLEKLEYRSVAFERKVISDIGEDGHYLEAPVVVYPSADHDFTQIVEYKHFTKNKKEHSILFYERLSNDGEP